MMSRFSTFSIKAIVVVVLICTALLTSSYFLLFADDGASGSLQKSAVYLGPRMAVVRLSPTDIVPTQVEVSLGSAVTFINTSKNIYWIASTSESELPGFGSAVNPGESYSYVYDTEGVWTFSETAYGKLKGTVVVTD